MREAETESHEGKRKSEALWPIFKIHHQKARYIYDLFYRRKAISRELYEFCIKASFNIEKKKLSVKTKNIVFHLSSAKLIIDLQEKIADGNLIAKWKKQGYENLCCLRCIQTRDTNFATNCICRWEILLFNIELPFALLQGAQGETGGREDRGVYSLWLQRMFWIISNLTGSF